MRRERCAEPPPQTENDLFLARPCSAPLNILFREEKGPTVTFDRRTVLRFLLQWLQVLVNKELANVAAERITQRV